MASSRTRTSETVTSSSVVSIDSKTSTESLTMPAIPVA